MKFRNKIDPVKDSRVLIVVKIRFPAIKIKSNVYFFTVFPKFDRSLILVTSKFEVYHTDFFFY